jgi:hypothetical protein
MLLDDMELLLNDLIGDVDLCTAAVATVVRPKHRLLDGEMRGDWLSPRRLSRLLLSRLRLGLRRRQRPRIEGALRIVYESWRRHRQRWRRCIGARAALSALCHGQEFGQALVHLRQLGGQRVDCGGELIDDGTQFDVLSLKCCDIDHVEGRSHGALHVDPGCAPSVPAPARRREVDAGEQRGQRCPVDLHLPLIANQGRELECARLKALGGTHQPEPSNQSALAMRLRRLKNT